VRDLDVLVRHRRGMWEEISDRTPREHDAADRAYRTWARTRLKDGRLVGFVATSADGTAAASGCLWMRENQPRPGWQDEVLPYLLSMFTEPAYRGKGLATRIVREAIAWAKAHGYTRMTLHASRFGRKMYRDLGFERTWEMRLRFRPPVHRRSPPRRRQRAK
jgi:GNAT superfamily N-acetyltransferase